MLPIIITDDHNYESSEVKQFHCGADYFNRAFAVAVNLLHLALKWRDLLAASAFDVCFFPPEILKFNYVISGTRI